MLQARTLVIEGTGLNGLNGRTEYEYFPDLERIKTMPKLERVEMVVEGFDGGGSMKFWEEILLWMKEWMEYDSRIEVSRVVAQKGWTRYLDEEPFTPKPKLWMDIDDKLPL